MSLHTPLRAAELGGGGGGESYDAPRGGAPSGSGANGRLGSSWDDYDAIEAPERDNLADHLSGGLPVGSGSGSGGSGSSGGGLSTMRERARSFTEETARSFKDGITRMKRRFSRATARLKASLSTNEEDTMYEPLDVASIRQNPNPHVGLPNTTLPRNLNDLPPDSAQAARQRAAFQRQMVEDDEAALAAAIAASLDDASIAASLDGPTPPTSTSTEPEAPRPRRAAREQENKSNEEILVEHLELCKELVGLLWEALAQLPAESEWRIEAADYARTGRGQLGGMLNEFAGDASVSEASLSSAFEMLESLDETIEANFLSAKQELDERKAAKTAARAAAQQSNDGGLGLGLENLVVDGSAPVTPVANPAAPTAATAAPSLGNGLDELINISVPVTAPAAPPPAAGVGGGLDALLDVSAPVAASAAPPPAAGVGGGLDALLDVSMPPVATPAAPAAPPPAAASEPKDVWEQLQSLK